MALAKDYSFNNQHRYIPYLVKVLYERGQSQPKDIYDEVANLAGITAEEKDVQGNSGETVYLRSCTSLSRGCVGGQNLKKRA